MKITIDLEPELEARLRRLAAEEGITVEEEVAEILEDQLTPSQSQPTLSPYAATAPAWLAERKPREPGGLADLFGKWPTEATDAEETDEELLAALKAMDDPKK